MQAHTLLALRMLCKGRYRISNDSNTLRVLFENEKAIRFQE